MYEGLIGRPPTASELSAGREPPLTELITDLLNASAYTGSAVPAPACANQPPTVNAGTDQTVILPETARLTGVVTDDGLPESPGAVTVTWTTVSGPGTVTFANATSATTTATFAAAGT